MFVLLVLFLGRRTGLLRHLNGRRSSDDRCSLDYFRLSSRLLGLLVTRIGVVVVAADDGISDRSRVLDIALHSPNHRHRRHSTGGAASAGEKWLIIVVYNKTDAHARSTKQAFHQREGFWLCKNFNVNRMGRCIIIRVLSRGDLYVRGLTFEWNFLSASSNCDLPTQTPCTVVLAMMTICSWVPHGPIEKRELRS